MAPPEGDHLQSWKSAVKAACQSNAPTTTACLLCVPYLRAAMHDILKYVTMARHGADGCSARGQRLCPSLLLKNL